MQYENIPTVQLLIIAEILGLIAAELLPGRAAAFKRVWRHKKRSTTRQLLGLAPNFAVPHAKTSPTYQYLLYSTSS